MNEKHDFTLHLSDDSELGGSVDYGDSEEYLTKEELIEAGYIEKDEESGASQREQAKNLGKAATKRYDGPTIKRERREISN